MGDLGSWIWAVGGAVTHFVIWALLYMKLQILETNGGEITSGLSSNAHNFLTN